MQRLRITAVCFQYTFVFMWTPAMEARTTVPPAEIPFGLIFASFMVSSIQFILLPATHGDRTLAAGVPNELSSKA
eukprot:COSAG06_NODE_2250_length_7240_cov_7.796218_3_plen_75_part_00